MQILADWIRVGKTGCVVGLAGAGKSNLLGFLCYRPDCLQQYLPSETTPPLMIPVDLNNLPAKNLATFYRVILRSFYETRHQFDSFLQQWISNAYRENKATRDPFLPQSALRELLMRFQAQQTRVVLVMDRFDKFCQIATPHLADSLRGLRDSFKANLSYIMGMRQEVGYLSNPSILGELYELLDTHVCWVGPMSEADARRLIAEETEPVAQNVEKQAVQKLLSLTGNHPALLKTACHWWLEQEEKKPDKSWLDLLLAEQSCQYRLAEIWAGLSQEEQLALSQVRQFSGKGKLPQTHQAVLSRLAHKGLLQQTKNQWRLFSELLAAYIATFAGESRGRIWLDRKTNILYQDKNPLDRLTPLEGALLTFFVRNPRKRHTYTDLMEAAWPEDEVYETGIAPDRLYQVIKELRRKIEPSPPKWRYIINWRGRPEGGYQFFPEGRPE